MAKTREADGRRTRESTLHWLIAFDPEHQSRALELLLKAGAEIEADIGWNHPHIDLPGALPGGSPLHFAIFVHQLDLLHLLSTRFSEGGYNLNFKGSSDKTPLEYAVQQHWHDLVHILVEQGALRDPTANDEVLHWISVKPDYEDWAVDGILSSRLGELSVKCAQQLAAVRPTLVDAPDEFGYTPIMLAAYHHKEIVVRTLLDLGCRFDQRTPMDRDFRTALSLYADNLLLYDNDNIIDLLFAAGASLESASHSGKRILHFAARNNVLGAAEKLLQLGAILDATTYSGETPLHVAAMYNSVKVGKFLLDKGANPLATHTKGQLNEEGWLGLTPFAFASWGRHENFIKLLLEYKVEPVARPNSDDTVFHFAVSEPDARMLDVLLRIDDLATADVLNRRNMNGMTALHLCAGNFGRHDHIVSLVEANAGLNELAACGHSALDLAYQTRERAKRDLNEQDQGIF